MPVSCRIGLHVGTAYGSIYCLHEGDPLQAGQILLNHYTTEEKVRRLISLGDLYILGLDPGLPSVPARTRVRLDSETHGIVNTECLAYSRDCEDSFRDHSPLLHVNLEHWVQYFRGNYNYFFQENTWWIFKKDKLDTIAPLKMQIAFEKGKLR